MLKNSDMRINPVASTRPAHILQLKDKRKWPQMNCKIQDWNDNKNLST
jgi:hypothetical protein